jgi:glucuronate isomerase
MATAKTVALELEEALAELPAFDVHTHLVGGKLAARGLHDILLYHMSVSDLYAAGCPSGARLRPYPGWPDRKEAHDRLRQAIPYLGHARNTSMQWMVRIILRDLYGWEEPITAENWEVLDATIRERADDPEWPREIFDRVGIQRTCTEWTRREQGQDDERLQYSLEWAFLARSQWGEFDTALYELERCWEEPVQTPTPIGGGSRPKTRKRIRTVEDVHGAMHYFLRTIPYDRIISYATMFSTDLSYRQVTPGELAAALNRRDQAGPAERDTYASYLTELFLAGLEKHAGTLVLQFSIAAEPLPFETGSRLSQSTIAQLGEIIARHSRLRFQCFLASRHNNQAFCTLARELPNLSLVAYWWHNFFPGAIRQVMEERLDMLPVNKQVGFFSDAYCAEWVYGKMILARKMMAQVFAQKIEQGQYGFDEAVSIARSMLFETPQAFGMVAREERHGSGTSPVLPGNAGMHDESR